MTNGCRSIGYDPNGIPRVYVDEFGEGDADPSIWEEIKAYVKHRPDTGPMNKWSVKFILIDETMPSPVLDKAS